MAKNVNIINHLDQNSNTKSTFDNNSEDDLIDLDKELPLKLHSNWLLECNGNSSEFQDSFSKLHFSNPFIKEMVKSVYQSGKSKLVLHQLLYSNERMTMSCDNCSNLYRNNKSETIFNNRQVLTQRHSSAVTSLKETVIHSSSSSLTDSLDSLTIADNEHNLSDKNGNNLMTQSSIADYDRVFCAPTESAKQPIVKSVSSSQNVLSRTYDKEDLEILKKTELSQSVFVPHISGSRIDHYSEIEIRDKSKLTSINQRHTFARSAIEATSKSSYHRVFPICSTNKVTNETGLRPRPSSTYQMEKLTKSTIDRCIKMNQIKHSNFNAKKILQMNEHIFETEVLTPINSPRNVKHFLTSNQQTKLKRPNTSRK